jgi:hypothetical protein
LPLVAIGCRAGCHFKAADFKALAYFLPYGNLLLYKNKKIIDIDR